MNKEGSFVSIVIVMVLTLIIAFYWEKLAIVRDALNFALNPTIGALLNWNINVGMIIIVFFLTLATTLVQKYTTDQKTLKEMKKEQKNIQEEMKKYKGHPEKFSELSKRQMELFPKMMKLSMRPIIFTGIPFVLLFRWFSDYFNSLGDFLFFGRVNWIIFYLILSIIFSGILRKILKVV